MVAVELLARDSAVAALPGQHSGAVLREPSRVVDSEYEQQRHRKPDRANDQRRPEAFPEPIDERDQREMVMFEAEPAVAREPLNAEGLVPGLMSVDEDERARGEERGNRECD